MSDNTDELPRLTPEVVADDEALARLVDRLHEDDPHVGARTLEIALAETDLMSLAPREVWERYLAVNSLTQLHEVLLIRWAFQEGRKHPMRGGAP